MDDLISRAAAIGELMQMVEQHQNDSFGGVLLHYTGVKAMLECLPAVDAVPVIRCKNCKYFEFISDRPVRHGKCKISDDMWAEDSFCSAGERKKIDGRTKKNDANGDFT